MISARMKELLRQSAADLRDGRAPLDHAFLVEHDVTIDEAFGLADLLAVGVDALLELDNTTHGRRVVGVAMAGAIGEAS